MNYMCDCACYDSFTLDIKNSAKNKVAVRLINYKTVWIYLFCTIDYKQISVINAHLGVAGAFYAHKNGSSRMLYHVRVQIYSFLFVALSRTGETTYHYLYINARLVICQ